jgi:hypothetical protein
LLRIRSELTPPLISQNADPVQTSLGSQGYAPIASLDTEIADLHRRKVTVQRHERPEWQRGVCFAFMLGAYACLISTRTLLFDGADPIRSNEFIDREGKKISPVHGSRGDRHPAESAAPGHGKPIEQSVRAQH